MKISKLYISLIIAFVYVGMGTIYSLVYWTHNNPADGNELLNKIFFCFFAPSALLPILIQFTEREPGFLIFICQLVTLLIVWCIINGIINLPQRFSKKTKDATKKNNDDN